jgi:hypothetical protein
MGERSKSRFITYTEEEHGSIVKQGANTIKLVLETSDIQTKLSILLYLDKYLDEWFGYEVNDKAEILSILEKHLFIEENADVREDILNLLGLYNISNLDYLAEHITELYEEDLLDAITALGSTFNGKYFNLINDFGNNSNELVRISAREAKQNILDCQKKVKEELLKQINQCLNGEISREKFYEISGAYYTKYTDIISNTEFNKVYLSIISDVCLLTSEGLGLYDEINEVEFHKRLETAYINLFNL